MNSEIPDDDEDISYEMTVNNKRYQASFSYFDPDRDQSELMDMLLDICEDFFTEEQMVAIREYCNALEGASEVEQEELQAKLNEEMHNIGVSHDEEKYKLFMIAYLNGLQELADGDVWFMIHETYGKYQIGLYYDNRHNQAHGEDL